MMHKVFTMSPSALLHTLIILFTLIHINSAYLSRCPEGYFRNRHLGACQLCRKCPVNEIIRRPCKEFSNTLCGPFTEFLEFHQAPRPSLEVADLPLIDDGDGGYGTGDVRSPDDNRSRKIHEDLLDSLNESDNPKRKHHKGNKSHRNRKGDDATQNGYDDTEGFSDVQLGSVEGERGSKKGHVTEPRDALPEEPSMQNPEDGENQWKVLALALIVVLCVVCIFLIVFVFVVCYLRSRRAHLKQVVFSADKGPTARAAGQRAFQSMHYVPVLTHAQGRGGSSGLVGTAGNVGAAAGSSYMFPDDYDADNSGQTISTAKSSDYVYFKSPHNGNEVYDV